MVSLSGRYSPGCSRLTTPLTTCGHLRWPRSPHHVDPELVVPDPLLSLEKGAIAVWVPGNSVFVEQMFQAMADHYKFDMKTPFKDLPETVKQVLLYGSGEEQIDFHYERDNRRRYMRKTFEGVIPNLEHPYTEVRMTQQ